MGKMEQQNTIQFVLGEETRPKVDFLENGIASIHIESSIFYKQYSLAMTSIAELVAYNNVLKGNVIQNEHFIHNNIIVFNGDRGSGKTSCMLSVKELLCNGHLKQKYLSKLDITDAQGKVLADTNFYSTEIIDPIFFDEKHNILELFIGTLFKNFSEFGKQLSQEKRYILLDLFSNAKRDLALLDGNINLSEDDNLEQLDGLVASMNIKKSLWRLVKKYLEVIHLSKDSQLILCIDDIDLNMAEGYQMIDQIRKYLNIPGLVILLAIKMDQLSNVIRIKYFKDYEPLLNQKPKNSEERKKYEEIINQIVERYITKLFPLSQRISMPTVEDILKRDMNLLLENGAIGYTFSPLKEGILKLIYSRTRMLFYNSNRQVNFIIPRNLRELLNFLHFLYNMKEVKNHVEAIPNVIHFKTYFYGTWCTNNLKEDDLAFMRSTQNFLTAVNINSSIINFLKERFRILAELENKENDKISHLRELAYILNKENIMYNLSLGDVLACLDWLNKVCNKDEDLKLLFAIKVFYSMALYENYKYKNEILAEEKLSEKEIINKQTLTKNETNYGDIVNGAFFNSEYMNVAPYEKENGLSRCRRIIDNKLLMDLFEYLMNPNETSSLLLLSKDVHLADKNLLQQIIDFFILTTSFVYEAKDKEKDEILPKYRRRNEVYYERLISKKRKFICFDILSIFYNLLNVEKTYERFNFPKDWDKVLYKDMLNEIEGDTDEIKIGKLHYKMNLRNVEVIEQISYLLQRKRPDSGSDSIELYKKIFEALADYKNEAYDSLKIDYECFRTFVDFFDKLSKSEIEREIFESIYSDKESSEGKDSQFTIVT